MPARSTRLWRSRRVHSDAFPIGTRASALWHQPWHSQRTPNAAIDYPELAQLRESIAALKHIDLLASKNMCALVTLPFTNTYNETKLTCTSHVADGRSITCVARCTLLKPLAQTLTIVKSTATLQAANARSCLRAHTKTLPLTINMVNDRSIMMHLNGNGLINGCLKVTVACALHPHSCYIFARNVCPYNV